MIMDEMKYDYYPDNMINVYNQALQYLLIMANTNKQANNLTAGVVEIIQPFKVIFFSELFEQFAQSVELLAGVKSTHILKSIDSILESK